MPTTISGDGPQFAGTPAARADEIDKVHKKAPKSKSLTAIILGLGGFLFLLWTLFLATDYWHNMAAIGSVPHEQVFANASVSIMFFVAALGIQVEQLSSRREYIKRELAKLT